MNLEDHVDSVNASKDPIHAHDCLMRNAHPPYEKPHAQVHHENQPVGHFHLALESSRLLNAFPITVVPVDHKNQLNRI